MTTTNEEAVLVAVLSAIRSINGSGPWNTDLSLPGIVDEEDTAKVFGMVAEKPRVIVGFDSVQPGDTPREAWLALQIDVTIERGYWERRSLSPQAALLRIAGDIRASIHGARNTASALNVLEWSGTDRHRSDDGAATQNGCTIRYRVKFSDPTRLR